MKHKAAVFLGLAVAAILLPAMLSTRRRSVSRPAGEPAGVIRCVLDLGAYEDSTYGLINGYNYYLLQKFAKDNGITAEVRVAELGGWIPWKTGAWTPWCFLSTSIPATTEPHTPYPSTTLRPGPSAWTA